MKLSIAQALTYKKRVAEAIAKAKGEVETYNSVESFEGAQPNRDGVDVKATVNRRAQLKAHMVDLKLRLWEASAPIRRQVLELAELKDDAAFWGALETKHGKFKDKYETTPTTKDAVFQKNDVDAKVTEIKKAIDAKQQEIEAYNHTNFVELDEVGI